MEEYLSCDNTGGEVRGAHAAVYQVPVSWGLDFKWTAVYIHTFFTISILNSDLREI